jgi:hypothetical protein
MPLRAPFRRRAVVTTLVAIFALSAAATRISPSLAGDGRRAREHAQLTSPTLQIVRWRETARARAQLHQRVRTRYHARSGGMESR